MVRSKIIFTHRQTASSTEIPDGLRGNNARLPKALTLCGIGDSMGTGGRHQRRAGTPKDTGRVVIPTLDTICRLSWLSWTSFAASTADEPGCWRLTTPRPAGAKS